MRWQVIHQICNVAGVNVGKPKQTSRKVRGIVVRTEHAAELFVENTFGCLPAEKKTNGIGEKIPNSQNVYF